MKKVYDLKIDDAYTMRSSLQSFGVIVEDEELAKKFVEKYKDVFYNVDYCEKYMAESLEEIEQSEGFKSEKSTRDFLDKISEERLKEMKERKRGKRWD